MSNITKKALASSLKKILSKKEFNKITINDITEDCGVNRQTFYYHFKDIYDLLEWIYTNEVIGKIKNLETDNPTENWQQEFLYVFEYIIENKKFVYNTYYSVSRSFFLNFVYQQTNLVLTKAVNEKSKNMNIDEKNKKFIADFRRDSVRVFHNLLQFADGVFPRPDKSHCAPCHDAVQYGVDCLWAVLVCPCGYHSAGRGGSNACHLQDH